LFSQILSPDVQAFIGKHENDDTSKLLLKQDAVHGVPMRLVVQQIIGRKKAKDKLPLYFRSGNIVYPPGTNMEQSSSEETARYKSRYMASASPGGIVADLTGGLGVDAYFFGVHHKKVVYVEPDLNLLQIARHNHQQLGLTSVDYFNTTAEAFLSSATHAIDWIFIDPSRRTAGNRRVASLSECIPNVISLIPGIFEAAGHLLVKASPLLDIQQGTRDLQFVKRIVVVSVQNECKELLFECERNFREKPVIEAVNLLRNGHIASFAFRREEEDASSATFSAPLSYLYEPNASILKAGAFKLVGERYKLAKLHPSTHLYTANTFDSSFPGTVFRIMANVKPDFRKLTEYFPDGRGTVATRNYPLSALSLKAKTGLRDGGNHYLIGFTGKSKKYLVAAEKVS